MFGRNFLRYSVAPPGGRDLLSFRLLQPRVEQAGSVRHRSTEEIARHALRPGGASTQGRCRMFNTRKTSAWAGSCVAYLRRIEGPLNVARPRHDQVDVLAPAIPGMFQRDGMPQV